MENGRKMKRGFRLMGMDHPVEMAYNEGTADGFEGRPKRNPYPKGRRRDEYERGYDVGGTV